MHGPPTEVEPHQLDELILAIEDLRRRVAALEQRALPPVAEFSAASPGRTSAAPSSTPADFSTGVLAALGRLLLGIAGAYLLRAITEAAILPQLAGTLAGLLYAGAWLVSSARLASPNRIVLALQALTAALIAAPLLWEATLRFHSLTPEGAAAALALFVVLGQAVAWRRDLAVVAGVTVLAGSATAIALIIATLNPLPFSIGLLMAAAVVEYAACRDRGFSYRWILALAVDFCAFLLIYVATRREGLPEGYAPVPIAAVVGFVIALASVYLAGTVIRTLVRGLAIAWFEIAQLAAAIMLAIACGLRVTHGTGAGMIALGSACLAGGVLAYLAAFASIPNRRLPPRNFHAFASFAILLVLSGSGFVFHAGVLAGLWSVLALAATWLGERSRGNTLRMHGALYLAAAAWASGLLNYAADGMLAASGRAWKPMPGPALLCALAAVLAYGLVLRVRKARTEPWTERVSAAMLAALLTWSAAGFAAGWLLAVRWDASFLSTLRTAVVAVLALALAWFGRRWNLTELIWVLYPWMTFGALKLFVEDFRQGRPATLFLSLLLYGGTLIALPRLLRRARRARADLS